MKIQLHDKKKKKRFFVENTYKNSVVVIQKKKKITKNKIIFSFIPDVLKPIFTKFVSHKTPYCV